MGAIDGVDVQSGPLVCRSLLAAPDAAAFVVSAGKNRGRHLASVKKIVSPQRKYVQVPVCAIFPEADTGRALSHGDASMSNGKSGSANGDPMNRREFAVTAGAAALVSLFGCQLLEERTGMYGIIGKMIAHNNKRDELIAILLDGTKYMPGCMSYVISKDLADENSLWITEVWENRESHRASLSLESVQQAIARGKPLIAGFGERFETSPVGGCGLG